MSDAEDFGLRKLTIRELPLEDPSVDALGLVEREAIATMWASRAESEVRVAASFAIIARELLEGGADPQVLAMTSRAVADEVRHAEICRRVASRYRGAEVAWPSSEPVRVPAHEGAGEELRRMLHVVGMCCINETIGSAFLEMSHRGARAPLARAALRDILSDEIDHGRIGWAHLASSFVSTATRGQIGRWMVRLLRASLRIYETQNVSTLVNGVAEHGLPSIHASNAAAYAAIRELILPGFERLGIDMTAARQWAAALPS